MKYLFFTTIFLLSNAAFGQETWVCEDATGHRYQSSQKVQSDSCTKLEGGMDPKSVELPKRENPKWGVEDFCKGQKRGTCEVSADGLQRGALNGEWFQIFADSGVVAGTQGAMPDRWSHGANWDISCSRDKMTSVRSCLINKGDLYFFVRSGGKVSVSVGVDHFPSSQTSIKIGSRRFNTMQRDGYFENGSQLIAQMRNGTPIVTRYMKWPYRTWVDEEFTAFGVNTAMHVARWIIAKGEM